MRPRNQILAAGILIAALAAVGVLRFGVLAHPAQAHGRTSGHATHAPATHAPATRAPATRAPAIIAGSCTPSPWGIATTPTVSSGVLTATAAVSSRDVWAVGYVYDATLKALRTLTERWDGSIWNLVPSPNASTNDNQLYGVAALAPNNVWAVGGQSGFPLIEHWDGTTWSIVAGPSGGGQLNAISAVSASDIWAVGYAPAFAFDTPRALTDHWDGTSWSTIPSADIGTDLNELYGAAAVSATDVWAVGYFVQDLNKVYTLLEHWDGTSWTAVANPPSGGFLFGVSATSSNDVWAVGEAGGGLILHWNGTNWSVIPPVSQSSSPLSAVSAVSANDVWVVGSPHEYNSFPPFTAHWDGTTWSVVPTPAAGLPAIYGVVAISATDVWAVGEPSQTFSSLAMHYPTLFQAGPTARASARAPSRHAVPAIPCA